jgi:phosphodiesterase/alkaline phosphatase D-like protein
VLKITTSSAELTGTVNPQKTGATTYRFDYGPTIAYGQSTPESAPIPSDNSVHPAAMVVEGLSPGVIYHYRIVATSPTGSARGPDQKFTTIPGLPAVSSSSISDLAVGKAVLHADISTNFGTTVAYFQYGPSVTYGSETIPDNPLPGDATTHPVTADVDGLAPSAIYHYRAVATNYAGVAYGPDQTFETPGLPGIGAMAVSNVTKSGATVSAQLNPQLAPTTYRFEYGPTVGYGASTVESGPLAGDKAFHTVTTALSGLTPGTTYHVRLSATNGVGGATGSDQAFTTLSVPAISPPPPASCKKGQVKKKGKCVKKPRKHRHKSHKRRGK